LNIGSRDDRFRRFVPQCPKQALHDRMLLLAERGRIDLGEPANDGESGFVLGPKAKQQSGGVYLSGRCGSW